MQICQKMSENEAKTLFFTYLIIKYNKYTKELLTLTEKVYINTLY